MRSDNLIKGIDQPQYKVINRVKGIKLDDPTVSNAKAWLSDVALSPRIFLDGSCYLQHKACLIFPVSCSG